MLKGFKEFVLRGNIVDLAVALVIGIAFATVVEVIISAIITPILAAFGGAETPGLGFYLRDGAPATFVDFGAIINALIVFVITAAVVYFIIVVPMNKLAQRRAAGMEEEPEAPTEDVVVLREIRDLLAARESKS
ncbi:MAG: large conductance mechanosensitive channel protein MscL [Ornithinimicrobium sp.]